MRQKGNDVVFKNAGRKLLTKRKKRLLYKRMDNKVTKKRIALHFEYDWLKYLLVIILSAFVMYMIFMQINITRDFERLEVFFFLLLQQRLLFKQRLSRRHPRRGRRRHTRCDDFLSAPVGEYYGQLFTSAGFTSDVLIIRKSEMQLYADWFLEMDEQVLAACVPDELKDSLEYYVYSAADRDPEYVNPDSEGKIFGIRVDNLKKIAVENPPFVFDVSLLNPDLTEEELASYDTEFYIVLDKNSVKIGDKGKKEEYHDLTQAFRFVRFFLEKYAL